MIESKCSNCGTVFQVPKPGKYHCHSCNNTVNVKDKRDLPLTSPVIALEESPKINDDINIEYDPAAHTFKRKPGAFFSTVSVETEPVYTQSSIPWENKSKIGFFTAFFRTIKKAISSPKIFFSAASSDQKKVKNAWGFAVAVSFLCVIIRNLILNIFFGTPVIPDTFSINSTYGSLVVILYFSAYIVGIIISIVIIGAILNFGATLMGARTSSGVGQLIYCYSLSANVFATIPIDIFANLIVAALSAYICYEGLIKFYRMRKARAAFAALFPQLISYSLLFIFTPKIH